SAVLPWWSAGETRPPPPRPPRLQPQLGDRAYRPVRPGQRIGQVEQRVRPCVETVIHVPPELGQPRQRLGLPGLTNLTHDEPRGCLGDLLLLPPSSQDSRIGITLTEPNPKIFWILILNLEVP